MNKIFTLLAAAGLAMSANAAVLWEGEVVMGDWKGELDLSNQSAEWAKGVGEAFQDIEEGDKLTFTYKDMSTNPDKPCQIQLVSKVGPDWKWTQFVDADEVPASGVYTYNIDGNILGATDWTDLETFPQRGIIIKGQGGTLTKVELVKKNGEVQPAEGTVVWTGSFDLAGWNGCLEYKNVPENTQWNKSVMSGLKKGDKIVFHCEAEAGAQI